MVESPGKRALLHAKWAAGLEGWVVIANPIRSVRNEAEVIDPESACHTVPKAGDRGKRLTPFLLDKIVKLAVVTAWKRT
jgi:pseudouridine-5'-phosphate glycosidase